MSTSERPVVHLAITHLYEQTVFVLVEATKLVRLAKGWHPIGWSDQDCWCAFADAAVALNEGLARAVRVNLNLVKDLRPEVSRLQRSRSRILRVVGKHLDAAHEAASDFAGDVREQVLGDGIIDRLQTDTVNLRTYLRDVDNIRELFNRGEQSLITQKDPLEELHRMMVEEVLAMVGKYREDDEGSQFEPWAPISVHDIFGEGLSPPDTSALAPAAPTEDRRYVHADVAFAYDRARFILMQATRITRQSHREADDHFGDFLDATEAVEAFVALDETIRTAAAAIDEVESELTVAYGSLNVPSSRLAQLVGEPCEFAHQAVLRHARKIYDECCSVYPYSDRSTTTARQWLGDNHAVEHFWKKVRGRLQRFPDVLDDLHDLLAAETTKTGAKSDLHAKFERPQDWQEWAPRDVSPLEWTVDVGRAAAQTKAAPSVPAAQHELVTAHQKVDKLDELFEQYIQNKRTNTVARQEAARQMYRSVQRAIIAAGLHEGRALGAFFRTPEPDPFDDLARGARDEITARCSELLIQEHQQPATPANDAVAHVLETVERMEELCECLPLRQRYANVHHAEDIYGKYLFYDSEISELKLSEVVAAGVPLKFRIRNIHHAMWEVVRDAAKYLCEAGRRAGVDVTRLEQYVSIDESVDTDAAAGAAADDADVVIDEIVKRYPPPDTAPPEAANEDDVEPAPEHTAVIAKVIDGAINPTSNGNVNGNGNGQAGSPFKFQLRVRKDHNKIVLNRMDLKLAEGNVLNVAMKLFTSEGVVVPFAELEAAMGVPRYGGAPATEATDQLRVVVAKIRDALATAYGDGPPIDLKKVIDVEKRRGYVYRRPRKPRGK